MDVSGSCFHKPLHHTAQSFPRAVVDIGFQFKNHIFPVPLISLTVKFRLYQKSPKQAGSFITAFSRAYPNFHYLKLFRELGRGHDSRRNCRPRRCYQFSLYFCNSHRKPAGFHNIYHRRNRNRKNSVLAPDRPRSLAYKRHYHFRNVQIIQTHCCRNNIYNGVHCPYFMKMYLRQGNAVGFGLRLRQYTENPGRRILCTGSYLRFIYNIQYFRQPPVVMGMLMAVHFLFFMVMVPMTVHFLFFMVMVPMTVHFLFFMVMMFMPM